MGLRLLVLALVGVQAWARRTKYDTAYRFAQITDIHIEPFYNPETGHAHGNVCRAAEAFNKSQCTPFQVEPEAEAYPFGRLNCDPPMALLRSVMEHMERVAKHAKPEFVLFTGDVPSHQLSCQYHQARTIQMVVEYLVQESRDVAPLFYPVMGNNDYFPNYNISFVPGNDWQRYIAGLYGRTGVIKGKQLEDFGYGGYYSATPRKGLRLVVLNTVVWSQKVLDWGNSTKKHVTHHDGIDEEAAYQGPDEPLPGADTSGWRWDQDVADSKEFIGCLDRPRDPYEQFAWLEQQLLEAQISGEKVILAGHVPPGDKVGDNNWCTSHLRDMEELARKYADIIELQLYGDHSNDEFRMVWSEAGPKAKAISSVLVSAGVTPRKHCNPSWRMFDVSSDHEVHDFTQYYMPLTRTDIQWNLEKKWRKLHREGRDEQVSWRFWKKQYSFRQEYGVGLDPDELESLWLKMQVKPEFLKKYLRHMFSETVGYNDYFDYICDMRYLGEEANLKCAALGRLLNETEGPEDAVVEVELQRLDEEDLATDFAEDFAGRDLEGSSYIQVHPAALFAMVVTCGVLLTSTILLAWRLRVRDARDYVSLA